MKLNRILILLILIFITISNDSNATSFDEWKANFKIIALKNGISEITYDATMQNVKFLPNVIKYDRYQPEFYEDTKTYVSKRTSNKKVKSGKKYYLKNKIFINKIDSTFDVEKELLLALMGIETNFGTYLGKMDIISSLATLSYDKRRSAFFTNELITILKLVDKGIVNPSFLFGSWAGAFGNFQFMPTTIDKYAIDFNENNIIELTNSQDSFASAANYLKKIGWKKNEPCYFQVNLKSTIPSKFLNTSAKKIKNKKKIKYFKKFINEDLMFDENAIVAIITPDAEIVDNAKINYPAYIVFSNYELILKWNRSLRFGLAVCTLKNKFKNEL